MDPKFLIERQGKSFVLYAGLLDEAHKQGLLSVKTSILQFPSPDNGNTCIAHAAVEIEKAVDGGVRVLHFEGVGDANEGNVGRMIAPHAIRMAETRAKARALRDAINVGAAAFEELGDADDEPAPARPQPPRRPPPPDMDDVEAHHARPAAAPTPINRAPATGQHQSFDQATPAQVRAIYLIGRDQLGETDEQIDDRSIAMFHKPPPELTKKQASDLITRLKAGRAG